MLKKRLWALLLIILSGFTAFFVYYPEIPKGEIPFKLGLDLAGGTHLVYQADTTQLKDDVAGAMDSLRDVIERRVNIFGVSEPLVQVEEGKALAGSAGEHRLIVELPGVTDLKQAIDLIGRTPMLEFRLANPAFKDLPQEELEKKTLNEVFLPTGLTGRYLKNASMAFDQTTGEPRVVITFNDEGTALFARVTKENVGTVLAIFLDGLPISTPVIRQEITGGTAEISGGFAVAEARTLARDLSYGALPVPITLVGTQTIGATLGEVARDSGVKAGVIALIVISIFLIIWYRVPGIVAVLALSIYTIINLALFKFLPGPFGITLTAAGVAGFILSIGMAVDANILIFERMKEEIRRGRTLPDAMQEGFTRAWTSIRDSNLSSMITAGILFYFASSSVVKGFAVVFGLGVLTSMFSAITATRTMLFALGISGTGRISRFLFSSGFINLKALPSQSNKN